MYGTGRRVWRLAMVGAAALAASGPSGMSQAQPQGDYDQPRLGYAQGEEAAHRALAAEIRAIGTGFNGDIGIAVEDVQTGWTTAYDGDTYFPQQSVSKFWVALTALNKADQGALSLGAPVTLHRDDITLFHQPIAAQIRGDGYTT
ncbi:MAG: beta-lactamase class, partial [Sphingomonadales bacterium]|nr:beta-lactamase class [Sphingomonadales bacterium]